MDWDELVNTIRPFVLRYTKAHPDLATFWYSDESTLQDIDSIMKDWWEWVRRGEGANLFVGQNTYHIRQAFEQVLWEQLETTDNTAAGEPLPGSE